MDLYEKLLHAKPFFLIAGPCVIEDDDVMLETAAELKKIAEQFGLLLIFKSSYKKANRTSETSYSGPGLKEGLQILSRIKSEFGLPILSDVHETWEVEIIAEVCDIIQIPAFLSRQTELLHAAALSGKIVNIKKGQFMAPEDMIPAIEKVTSANNYQVLQTERGTSFGYHNLVVDFRSFAMLRYAKYPVVYDVTHSLQRPSINRISGGTPEYASMMAQAAIATGMVDGLFIETHPNPMEAMSDSASMLPLDQLPELLEKCIRLKQALDS
ncbi:MAG: 3-deoxy-8-phosphooctulonate synthase [Candidatus Cloacimonetes bacterium HGW-Cloacimonetes-1]|jgi:2-dehydro-3-deoxyphosphooctonate aldolase (KDO 8-P synthase)|nr:MAG: 3-deoxy-8-phosphooctulonate synthase [Candidatus Cloacimonetes bacterium HGW-Cloacimonetes-1]